MDHRLPSWYISFPKNRMQYEKTVGKRERYRKRRMREGGETKGKVISYNGVSLARDNVVTRIE